MRKLDFVYFLECLAYKTNRGILLCIYLVVYYFNLKKIAIKYGYKELHVF